MMRPEERARVLVADDHASLLDRVVKTLAAEFSVVAAVADGAQLVAAEEEFHPDVLVIDLCMPTLNGLEATACIRRRGSQVPVVCLTAYDDPEMMQAAWEAGALGYVTKTCLAADLVPAVRAALEGRRFVSAPFRSSTPTLQ
jgi:DNA-binding NarL/FixJ family response regulator